MPKATTTTVEPNDEISRVLDSDFDDTTPPADPIPDDDNEPEPPLFGADDDLGFYALDETDDEINALYYGREGTGKTTSAAFMANLPGVKRILIVNAEAGAKKAAFRRRGIDTTKIVMWPPRGQRVSFESLERLHVRILSDLDTDPHSWDGVIFDSVTEIATTLREDAMSGRHAKLDRQGVTYDENESDVSDYTILGDQMRKILRRFRDLPCHFVATALEREDDKTKTVGPDVTPAVARAILGYVDFVLYCRTDQEAAGETEEDLGAEFRALTRANSRFRAKDRFDVTPRVLADPNFVRLHGYTTGEILESEDELQIKYTERRLAREAEAKRVAEEKERKAAEARERKTKNAGATK